MSRTDVEEQRAVLEVENVGGIDETTVTFQPGVTILSGRNATNRTSLLQAVMAIIGSNNATLKADSERGEIELSIGEETYSRTLTQHNGRITFTGNPYLDDPMLADLFAFLLETNECRQAVARGDDLRELIMRPVDTREIEEEISELESKKDRIDGKLSDLSALSTKLPELEEQKQDLNSKIEDKEDEIAREKRELAEMDKSAEELRNENEELDTKMSDLQGKRTEVKDIKREIESETESIEALTEEVDEQKTAFDDLSPVADERIAKITEEMQRLRGNVNALDQTINELQSVIQFNDEFFENGHRDIADHLHADTEANGDSVTDELLTAEETMTCWTCGTEVASRRIESNLDSLRSLRKEKVQERQQLKQEINDLQSEKNDLENQQTRHRQLQRQIEQNEEEIADRKERIESLEARKERAESEVTDLEAEVKALQQEDHSEVLKIQEQVNEVEFELSDLSSKLTNTEEEINSIESRLDEREDMESRRSKIQEELEELRTHVEQLQKQAITEFNDHMEAILHLLDYNNLERIWIERKQETVREGRQKVDRERFQLHVVRSTESDTAYEDTVDHLSESEREVTGVIFALAGYLVHEVYETVPFMLLDSIEAIDSHRIARLVDYLEGHAEYLVVALLEEDAAALDDSYPRITSI